jgi:hypothetical protein
MAGAPVGNRNGAKANRMLTDALKRELTQRPEDVLAIARRLIESAKSGDPWAQNLIYDRVDGKVPQALIGGDEDDPAISVVQEILIRAIDATGDRPTKEGQ